MPAPWTITTHHRHPDEHPGEEGGKENAPVVFYRLPSKKDHEGLHQPYLDQVAEGHQPSFGGTRSTVTPVTALEGTVSPRSSVYMTPTAQSPMPPHAEGPPVPQPGPGFRPPFPDSPTLTGSSGHPTPVPYGQRTPTPTHQQMQQFVPPAHVHQPNIRPPSPIRYDNPQRGPLGHDHPSEPTPMKPLYSSPQPFRRTPPSASHPEHPGGLTEARGPGADPSGGIHHRVPEYGGVPGDARGSPMGGVHMPHYHTGPPQHGDMDRSHPTMAQPAGGPRQAMRSPFTPIQQAQPQDEFKASATPVHVFSPPPAKLRMHQQPPSPSGSFPSTATPTHSTRTPSGQTPLQSTETPTQSTVTPTIESGATKGSFDDLNNKRVGRWTLAQLKQTDGIIPSQYGTNQFASRKGMTDYGAPRDVHGIHYHRLVKDDPEFVGREVELQESDKIITWPYGSNKFASKKGMTDFGQSRDVHGKHFHRLLEEDPHHPHFNEDALRQSDLHAPLVAGSNKFASKKGMTDFGMFRDAKGIHYHRLIEDDPSLQHISEDVLRQSDAVIGGQYGTNRFASRKGMTEYGASRDVHGKHYHHLIEEDPDLYAHFTEDQLRMADGIIGGQYGTNRFASRKGMTEYGAPRDVKGIHYHDLMSEARPDFSKFTDDELRQTYGIIPGQYGTNRFASRKGMTEYGAPRDVKGIHYHHLLEEDPSIAHFGEGVVRQADAIIPGQYGTNKYDSQKGMTKFGTPRDVHGTHLHRLMDEYTDF